MKDGERARWRAVARLAQLGEQAAMARLQAARLRERLIEDEKRALLERHRGQSPTETVAEAKALVAWTRWRRERTAQIDGRLRDCRVQTERLKREAAAALGRKLALDAACREIDIETRRRSERKGR